MLKKLALASTAIALLMSTASADYYIVQGEGLEEVQGRGNASNGHNLDSGGSARLQDPGRG